MTLINPPSADDQLFDDLSSLQDEFFISISEGPEGACNFASRLAQLEELTFKRTQRPPSSFDDSKLAAAYSAASTISTVTSGLFEVTRFADDLTTKLHSDITDLLEALSLTDANPKDGCDSTSVSSESEPSSAPLHASSRPTPNSSSRPIRLDDPFVDPPCYRAISHRWLCDNLHNPYPSAPTKRRIAESSGVSSKVVGEWFSQIRRRIGWTSVLKNRFGGNRQLCIDCAHNIFVEGTGCSFYSTGIIQDFYHIKWKLERLCKDRFGRSVEEVVDVGPTIPLNPGPQTRMKRQRDFIDDYSQERHEFPDLKVDSIRRPVKRMREGTSTDLHPLSRTASLSTSVSSRSSSAELLTPRTQISALPIPEFHEAIGEWASSVSTEAVEGRNYERHPSKKRSSSSSDSRGAGKRIKLIESDAHSSRSTSDSLHYIALPGERALLDLSDQFDFSLPPNASVGSELIDREPLYIDLFKYASWDTNQLNIPWELNEEYQSKTVLGDIALSPNDNVSLYQALTIGLNDGFQDTGCRLKQADVIAYADTNCPPKRVDMNLDMLKSPSSLRISQPDDTNTLPAESDPLSVVTATWPSLATTNAVDEEHFMKLSRINHLLAEAAQLQAEVFY